jgi:hypothetical protein
MLPSSCNSQLSFTIYDSSDDVRRVSLPVQNALPLLHPAHSTLPSGPGLYVMDQQTTTQRPNLPVSCLFDKALLKHNHYICLRSLSGCTRGRLYGAQCQKHRLVLCRKCCRACPRPRASLRLEEGRVRLASTLQLSSLPPGSSREHLLC